MDENTLKAGEIFTCDGISFTARRVTPEREEKEAKYWGSVAPRASVYKTEKEIERFISKAHAMLSIWNELEGEDGWWNYEAFLLEPMQILRKAMDLLNVCHNMRKNGRVPVGIVKIIQILCHIVNSPVGDDYSSRINDIAWELLENSEDTYLQFDLLDAAM